MEKQQCEGMQFYTVHVLSMTPSHTEVAIVGILRNGDPWSGGYCRASTPTEYWLMSSDSSTDYC